MSYKPILSLTISLLISLTLANEPEYSLVKCFWYEGKNMTVFDLIGLTRPRKQRE